MPGFVSERYGYTTASALTAQVITDMIAQGFTLVYKSGSDPSWNQATAGEKYSVILEAGGTVDPLNADGVSEKQPWRVMFDVQSTQKAFVHLGTPTTLGTNGKVPVIKELLEGDASKGAGFQPTDVVGTIGAKLTFTKFNPTNKPTTDTSVPPDTARATSVNGYLDVERLSETGIYTGPAVIPAMKNDGDLNPTYLQGSSTNPQYFEKFLKNENLKWIVDPEGTISGGNLTQANSIDDVTKGFINREMRLRTANIQAYPMSYRLVISPRGMWLGVWEESTTQETSAFFNWFLVQRPVDRSTGAVLTAGKAPVFCVNCVGNKYWKFTVRERDIMRPSTRIQADVDTEDSECILNSVEQVSLSEDGKYIVTFPSRLNTSRYRYPHELDMIGTTSADVVSQYSDVPLTVYGEAQPRSYRALHANGPSNTGMRLLTLQSGGGIS